MNQKKELPPVAYFTVMTYGGGDFAVIDIDGKQPLRVKNTAWYKFPLGKHKVYVYVAYDEDPWEMEIEAEDMSVIHLYLPYYRTKDKSLVPDFSTAILWRSWIFLPSCRCFSTRLVT